MLAKLMLTLDHPISSLEKKHPILSMILFQAMTAIVMITAVGGIALTGGLAIWLFYKWIGVM